MFYKKRYKEMKSVVRNLQLQISELTNKAAKLEHENKVLGEPWTKTPKVLYESGNYFAKIGSHIIQVEKALSARMLIPHYSTNGYSVVVNLETCCDNNKCGTTYADVAEGLTKQQAEDLLTEIYQKLFVTEG